MRFSMVLGSGLALVVTLLFTASLRPAAAKPATRPAAPCKPCPSPQAHRDADQDGLSDLLELRTGTNPLEIDTDGDGVADSVEDRNRDGVVNPGESDPRVSGLFPGQYPHIPEPMVFDLVRALGAKRGELEVNALAQVAFRRGRDPSVAWAPEVEWAILDGLAVEFEVPMVDRHVEALKLALQWSLPERWHRFGHGIQVIGEYLFEGHGAAFTALYLAGVRVGPVSFLTMTGARAHRPFDGAHHYEALINPSVFIDLGERVTLGIETNHAIDGAGSYVGAAIPQVHWQVVKRFRLQFGGGVGIADRRAHPLIALRAVLE